MGWNGRIKNTTLFGREGGGEGRARNESEREVQEGGLELVEFSKHWMSHTIAMGEAPVSTRRLHELR